MASVEERLAELGIELPVAATPVASYVPVVVSGPLAFVAGQVPLEGGKPIRTGRLGEDVTVEEGAELARRCALQALAALRNELGSLDRVRRIVRLGVFVASAEGFTEQPKVGNGASDVLVEIFGDAGRHARAAVSAPSLPLGVPVEVEVLAEVT
ncbi:MAG TPA: RidA family protein [Actinomycetota bacterium]|nr:RidA family protein [Actinomycetota bacterium]